MIRTPFLIGLLAVAGLVGGYLYAIGSGLCPAPLAWRVGVLDERFGLDHSAAIAAIEEAAAVWEEAVGRDLFVYDETADFPVNFVFDERQAFTDAESNFKDRLDNAETANDSIGATYETLVAEYEALQTTYEAAATAYEAALSQYNAKVDQFNEAGGAPPAEYEALQDQQRELDRERASLSAMVNELNSYVDEINRVGDRGNQLIETYNRGVALYNETFGESREFTQGDYQGDKINIYTFADAAELKLVLAHELGHALHLDHVAGPESILYFLIGEQPEELALSANDRAEFDRVCQPRSVPETIMAGYQLLFAELPQNVTHRHAHPHPGHSH